MLRDNLVGLIEPMRISAGVDPLALSIQKQASDDRSSCLENPRPEGAESSLTENVTSPFQAEPAQNSSVLAPADKVRSVKKFRVESGSVLAVAALIVSPVAAEVRSTGTATSFTVMVSVTCPILKLALTLVVSVT